MKKPGPVRAGNLVLLGLLLAGITIVYLLDDYQTDIWQRSRKREIENTAGIVQIRLASALVTRANSAELLAALLRLHPETSPEEFADFARNLTAFNPSLRALQFADSSTQVRFVYPPEGNEITIREPMVLITDPLRGTYVEKAIREQRMTVQPPFELRQGGLGIAVRNPIFRNGELTGLAIAVIDIPTILEYGFQGIDFQRMAVSLADSQGRVFWRRNELYGYIEERTVRFADSFWTVRISCTSGLAAPPFASPGTCLPFSWGFSFCRSSFSLRFCCTVRDFSSAASRKEPSSLPKARTVSGR